MATQEETMLTEKIMTKRECKIKYIKADLYLSEAVQCLMYNHDMTLGEAYRYIGL